MDNMHPDTLAALRTRLLAEIAGDPAYDGLGAADLAARLNAPVVVAQSPVYRDVPVSSVEGYMRLRTHIVRLKRWVATAEQTQVRDFAEEMLDMMAGGKVGVFETSVPEKRAAILGAFGALAEMNAGGFDGQSLADLTAMTIAPPGPPQVLPARWGVLAEGLPGIDGHPGPPNAASADLVEELIHGGG